MKMVFRNTQGLLAILMCITMFLAACNPKKGLDAGTSAELTTLSADQKMVFSTETLTSTEQLGTAMYIVKSGQNLFIGGSMKNPTLAKYNLQTNKTEMLDIDYSHDDVKLIYAMTSGSNEKVYLLTGDLPDYYVLDDEMVSNQNRQKVYCLLVYDTNGEFIERLPLPSLDTSMPAGVLIDKEDNIICWDERTIYVFDLNGSELFRSDLSNGQIMNIGFNNGTFLVHILENDETSISEFDISAKSLGAFTTDEVLTIEINVFKGTSIADDVYYMNSGSEIKKYNPDTGGYDLLFSWLDLGIEGSAVTSLLSAGKNQYYFLNSDSDEIGLIKGEIKNLSDIITLKLAVGYITPEVKKLIAEFKKTYPEYAIEVVDYEGQEGADKLLAEIISGNAPDVLDMRSLELSPYVEEKMLEDLNQYINDFNFVPSIYNALELDGKLYSLPSSFSISTFISESSLVEEKASWTLEEMNGIFNNSDKEHKFESLLTQSELLIYVCSYSITNFVDYNNGTCSFDNEEFIKWLELCNEMLDSYDLITDFEEYDRNALLRLTWVDNLYSLQRPIKLYGDNYTYIGFPNDNNNGSLFQFQSFRLAMSNQSKHKEEAWKFISTILTDEYQKSVDFFSISQGVFDENLTQSIDSNKKGELGLSEADSKKLIYLIESTETVDKKDFPIQYIIMEEAAYYFDGAKTVEEIVHNIQSRASILLAEQN